MRIINEMELEEGNELSLSNVKEALAAYAEKTFRDWQVGHAIKVNAATVTAPITGPLNVHVPTPGKKAKAAAARALVAAAAAAPPPPVAVATPMGSCSSWIFTGQCRHHLAGTCVRDHLPAHMGVFKQECYTIKEQSQCPWVCTCASLLELCSKGFLSQSSCWNMQ